MLATGSQAMIPKTRGIFAKRINQSEYEDLLRKRTVPEVAAQLKRHPFFGKSLATLSTTDPHRGQIEELLAMDLFSKYESVLRYDFSDDEFAGFYVGECEVREILKVLHLISIGMPGGYINQVPPYLEGKTDIDLFALGRARNFADVVEVLRFTPYYKTLKARSDKDPYLRNYPFAEAALLRFHYERLFDNIRAAFSGRERKAVEDLFRQEAEIYNLELIHRVKTYFARSYTGAEIRQLMLPYTFRIPKRKVLEMADAPSVEALYTLFRQTGAERITGPINTDELDATGGRVLYRHAEQLLHLTNSPSAALAAFITLLKLERDNVVNIIEGVRYGLPPEKIRSLLRN